ncbi:MAG: GNAT family N-acetyltransferase [Pseudomonadota bacterium]
MPILRPTTRADIPAVDALLAEAYPRLLAPDYPPSVLVTALPRISRAQPALLTSGTYWLAEEDGVLLAAGGWTAQAPRGRGRRGRGHIRHVVSNPDRLREGHARAVLEAAMGQARAAGITLLECISTRTAVPFYRALGFQMQGEVTVPLAPGIDFPAIQMTRPLVRTRRAG